MTASSMDEVLGFQGYTPCLQTGFERLEELDKARFIMSDIDENALLQVYDVAVEMNRNYDLGIIALDYMYENVSDKVVILIQRYMSVVNRMVWRKGIWGTKYLTKLKRRRIL